MTAAASQFVFMTCRPGAETALKQEIARTEPDWRLAFSRPGFVTFKVAASEPLDERKLAERAWTLARTHGLSLGKVTGTELTPLAAAVWDLPAVAALAASGFHDVHVWQRDAQPSDDAPTTLLASPLAAEIEAAVRAAAPAAAAALRVPAGEKRRPAPRHSRVLDVVLVAPNEWWIGCHYVTTPPQRWPGGAIPIRTPAHAVSRAYTKMAEALAWSHLPLAKDDECVELGCAPGGASQALLDRGLFVTGIDPAEVDPQLLEHPRFRHLRKRSKEVRRSEYLGVRWLAADMNLAPNYTLDAVEAVIRHPNVHIRGLVLTLKLADWSQAAELPAYVERVRGWGYRDVRLRQLATGGQEVCLVALRRKALRRLGGKQKSHDAVEPAAPASTASDASGSRRRVDDAQTGLAGPHFSAKE